MIRVIIADDQALVRAGILMLLSADDEITVVAQVASGHEAVVKARELHPDVVIMDLRMPGLDGVEATELLTEDPETGVETPRVLVLTTFDDDGSVYGSLRAGASGFLMKDAAPRDLLAAVRAVANGQSWLDPSVAGQVIDALRTVPVASATPLGLVARLTPRETEILCLMANGLSNTEISKQLVLSEATTRTHVSRVLMKTGSRDRTQAVVLAYQSGLVRVAPT